MNFKVMSSLQNVSPGYFDINLTKMFNRNEALENRTYSFSKPKLLFCVKLIQVPSSHFLEWAGRKAEQLSWGSSQSYTLLNFYNRHSVETLNFFC